MCAETDPTILPQLAKNRGWLRLIDGAQLALTAPTPAETLVPELGTPGRKAARRRNRSPARRLLRALNGEFTRSRRAVA